MERIKTACSKCRGGNRKVFPHNFRHMFARIFYRVTGNLVQLADILGHSSIEVTRIYAADGIMEWKKSMEMLEMLVE